MCNVYVYYYNSGKNRFLQNYRKCTYWINIKRPYLYFKMLKSSTVLFKPETVLQENIYKILVLIDFRL